MGLKSRYEVHEPSLGALIMRRESLPFREGDDPVLQGPQTDSQHLCRAFAVSAHVLERELDVGCVDFHERPAWLKRLGTVNGR